METRERELELLYDYQKKMSLRKTLEDKQKKLAKNKTAVLEERDKEIKKEYNKVSAPEGEYDKEYSRILESKSRELTARTNAIKGKLKTFCILFMLVILASLLTVSFVTWGSFDILKLGVVGGVGFLFICAFVPPSDTPTKKEEKESSGYSSYFQIVFIGISALVALAGTFIIKILNTKHCAGILGVCVLAAVLWIVVIVPLGKQWKATEEDASLKMLSPSEESRLEELKKQDSINKAQNSEKREAITKEVKERYVQKIADAEKECEACKAELQAVNDELRQIKVISKQDEHLIPEIIDLMNRNRADSVKEALLYIDEQKEKARREAEEKARREAERKARTPGRVHVFVGEYGSSSYRAVRNMIVIDGQDYGFADMTKTISLNPGLHSIQVVVQLYYGGNYKLHESNSLQFNLEGDGDAYFRFWLKNSTRINGIQSNRSTYDILS